MKSIKNSLVMILALMMLCTSLASTAFAAGIDTPLIPVPGESEENVLISPFYYSLNTSAKTATVTGYAGWQTDAVIPETVAYEGTTYTVTAIGESAFAAENNITSVTLTLKIKTVDGIEKYYYKPK